MEQSNPDQPAAHSHLYSPSSEWQRPFPWQLWGQPAVNVKCLFIKRDVVSKLAITQEDREVVMICREYVCAG